MRVLVTGIDGFVGSHLAEFLLRQHDVDIHGTIYDPEPSRLLRPFVSKLTLHRADVLDSGAIAQLIESLLPDRIIHLAGQAFIPTAVADPAGTFRTNVMGGVSILDAARSMLRAHKKGPAVLMVSSGEVYGHANSSAGPMVETMPLSPVNPYAVSKGAIDIIAQEFHRSMGVDVIVVRPFNHSGPRQSPRFVCSDFGRQFAQIALGKAPTKLSVGNLDSRRDFTDVRDVVRAYWMLFSRTSVDRIFNVCSGEAISIRSIISTLEEVTNIRVELSQAPDRLRPQEAPLIVGSCGRLQAATGWSREFTLPQTLTDVFTYWKEELTTQP